MSDKPHVDKRQITTGLAEVGLGEGDIALVHSSLSAFGYVEGGADTVIDALLETVGPTGTIVLPAFTWRAFHEADTAVLDLAHTPVKEEVGIIPETFRKRPQALRSEHICHSVAAIGPHAPDVMGEGVSSFGAGSTFHQLYELDAWCLFLGATFNSCTELHAVEEYMQVPYRYHRNFEGSTVIRPDGTEVPSRSIEFFRYPGYVNDFGKMRGVLEGHGVLHITQVGAAEIINVRIRDIFDITVGYMREDIGFLLDEASRQRLREEHGV
ncbi:MAG: AAC(3) family N-acetyltransferase [Armatimonadetes bacterium]|nr:AAC(3) family N-acetyltransferase [Armatimonadota bacterium]